MADARKPFRVRVVDANAGDVESELAAAKADGYVPSDHLALPALVLPTGQILLVFEDAHPAMESSS